VNTFLNKKKKKKKTHIPFRLNMLFFIVFLLFSVLILRLGVVQIVYGEDYKREIERTEDVTVNNPVPRGKMYDTNGNIVVDNEPENAITYTNNGASQGEMIEVAEAEGIPIQKNEVLVEALMQIELTKEIPPQLYRAVAEILAFVYRLEKAKSRVST